LGGLNCGGHYISNKEKCDYVNKIDNKCSTIILTAIATQLDKNLLYDKTNHDKTQFVDKMIEIIKKCLPTLTNISCFNYCITRHYLSQNQKEALATELLNELDSKLLNITSAKPVANKLHAGFSYTSEELKQIDGLKDNYQHILSICLNAGIKPALNLDNSPIINFQRGRFSLFHPKKTKTRELAEKVIANDNQFVDGDPSNPFNA